LCLALVLVLTAVAGAAESKTQWYAVFMGDAKIGHAQEQRIVQADTIISRENMVLTLSRGEISMTLSMRMQYEETPDGKPLGFEQEVVQGPLGGVKKAGVITDGKVQVTTIMAGQTLTSTEPYPAGALMSEGARRLMKSKGLKPGTTYAYDSFDPDSGKAERNNITVEAVQSVPLIGQVVKLTAVRNRIEVGGQTIEMVGYFNDDFEALKYEMPLPGMRLVVVACDEQYAKRPNEQFDLLAVTSPASPTPIPNARDLKAAVYTLKPGDPKVKLQLPSTDSQTVTAAADGTLTVRVSVLAAGATTRPYAGDDAAAREALKPSRYVQSDNAAIVEQARKLVGEQTDTWQAARTLEAFVRRHIDGKSLAVGYASALETLQNRQGDCTEHAVLLAALCRAAGIPCRLANGIVYADQFEGRKQSFIGHEWNQAYIGGKWVDLDAAVGVDAAHITFAVAPDDDDPTAMIGMLQSLTNLKIVEVKPGE
jgi:hypothetical protein